MSANKRILTTANFSTYYPGASATFKVWGKKKTLCNHILFAFLKVETMNVFNDDLFIRVRDKIPYEIVYDCDPSSLIPLADGSLKVIVSYQQRKDNLFLAVVRPFIKSFSKVKNHVTTES